MTEQEYFRSRRARRAHPDRKTLTRRRALLITALLLLLGLVLAMTLIFRKTDSVAAKLQIPYLMWLTFAAYLNLGVWYLNR